MKKLFYDVMIYLGALSVVAATLLVLASLFGCVSDAVEMHYRTGKAYATTQGLK